METNLNVSAICVRYSGLAALQDVSLTLNKGEIYGLIGPNGAGKTTFLNVVSGFQSASSGQVRLGGRPVTRWPPRRRAAAGLARTFQGTRIFPRFTVFENAEVAALAIGLSRRDASARAAKVLELFGLTDRADQVADTLPQGIARVVGIARALALGPDFLLLDEPAAGLDEHETNELGEHLRSVRDSFGTGILLVEHDVELVMSVCDRIHVLQMGRTIADGLPAHISANSAVREAYLGTRGEAGHA